MYNGFHKNIKQQNIMRRIVSWAPHQHIRMISEGSCDTEDWSNGCNLFILIKYIKIETVILNCNNISQYYCLCSLALVRIRKLTLKKKKKNRNPKIIILLKSPCGENQVFNVVYVVFLTCFKKNHVQIHKSTPLLSILSLKLQ